MRQPATDIAPHELGPVSQSKSLHVAERGPRVLVDEHRGAGAAGECLDRDGAGAGIEVEDAGALDAVAEGGKDRLADAVGGRPHLPSPRGDQPLPFELSGDHPHSGIGSAAPAPKRWWAASRRGPRAGSEREPWRRSSASTSRWASSSSGPSSGSFATAKRGSPL